MRFVFALAALVLAACTPPSNEYPPGMEMNFMRACEAASQIEGLCACTWDQIEANISPSDFAALDQMPGPERAAHPLTRQIEGYAMACHAQSQTPAATEPAATP